MKEIIVSEIEILPVKPRGGLVAFATCVIDGRFFVGDIGVHSRPDGSDYRLVFPSKLLPNGAKINVFNPINRETGDQLKSKIIEAYLNLAEKAKKTRRRSESGSGH